MKFNQHDLWRLGLDNKTTAELIQILQTKITYLKWHNKNYTKKQWYEIQDIADLIEALEVKE